jgi:aryl-alcohol dehydrogenase-like predicted oxidoreductase
VEQGIGVIPYYGLASGFLTGKYRSDADFAQSPRGATVKKRYFNERGQKVLAALDTVAKRHRAKALAGRLAWLMAQPAITAPDCQRHHARAAARADGLRRALARRRRPTHALALNRGQTPFPE